MSTVINIHKDYFMFRTGVMSCLWQCHVSLMHTPSNTVLPGIVVVVFPYEVCIIWTCQFCVLSFKTRAYVLFLARDKVKTTSW